MQQAERLLDIAAPDPDFYPRKVNVYPRKVNVYQHLIDQSVSFSLIFPFINLGSIITGNISLRGDAQQGRPARICNASHGWL